MKRTKLGQTNLQFSRTGNPISVRFLMEGSILFDAQIIEPLLKVHGTDQITIKSHIDKTLIGIFQEKAPQPVKITSAIIECIRYQSGQIRVCNIVYYSEIIN